MALDRSGLAGLRDRVAGGEPDPAEIRIIGARLRQRRSISDAVAEGAGNGCRSAPSGRVFAAYPAEPPQSRTGDPPEQPRSLAVGQDQRKGSPGKAATAG